MQHKATDLFSEWADIGKDKGMAKAHSPAVSEMLDRIFDGINTPFSFIDAGCGNGWVVRKVASMKDCINSCGIDGAESMIKNAKRVDPDGEYYLDDILTWIPNIKADVVFSMEVFYYFNDPKILTEYIVSNWIKDRGRLMVGVDHYLGNPDSHSWTTDLNVHMSLLDEKDWLNIFNSSGLKNCQSWKANQSENFPGTLVVQGDLIP